MGDMEATRVVIRLSPVRCCLITILSVTFAALASPSGAQTLGTFSWQVEPYCNVVTFTVTADGPSFRLVGYDNDCGAGRIPASGVATPNADGSVTLTFSLISDAGRTSHTTARLLPPAYSGAWSDDA